MASVKIHVYIKTLASDISILELSLFYQWCSLTTSILGLSVDEINARSDRIESLMKDLAEELRTIERSLIDEGPSEDMEAIAARLEVLKQAVQDNRKPPPQDLYSCVDEVNRVFFALTADFLEEDKIDPRLIQSCYLYYWLRTSTINAGVNEPFFQKLERNWPEVIKRVDIFSERVLTGSGS